MKLSALSRAGLLLVLLFIGFSLSAEERKIRLVTSILPVYCVAANVAGDLANVEAVVTSGSDPHDHAFSSKDLRRIKEADLILVIGLDLEGWLTKALDAADSKNSKKVVVLSSGLEPQLIHGITPFVGEPKNARKHDQTVNPHIWLNPVFLQHCVSNLVVRLSEKYPQHKKQFAANADQYISRLNKLDKELAETLSAVKDVPFFTLHDAFPYFAARYDLKLAGVLEELPDVKPSPRYLSRLYQVAKTNKVKAVFSEPFLSSKMVQQVAKDLSLKTGSLDPLESGELRSDSYETGMRKNGASLLKTLRP
jgi:ABC-type Zn uptake system ZnuABC Zn-binding protein ZnuA